ncbi:hypothetical protein SDRG_06312 [Saprolegnia diclina VS20]|uniref:AAA+ ATPase domain-containing protein n=1 Tax=Saprolegnia diclina (strain VS20) TaxID=1156394 RepID=T0S0J6_SAPDV|nr:hypothetical protein SDRG_06312 [Saprolegnia diclina VS20]EQC36202.1 hypothetical protein SDRG_06312 [Saprolegnia diclina VS20]|eukprot:XP_008610308.1 hypothetical protein SDRG_06312 [Saprolegnia diclina VS20]
MKGQSDVGQPSSTLADSLEQLAVLAAADAVAQCGTDIPWYRPTYAVETGSRGPEVVAYTSISAMDAYAHKSVEELRFEDYLKRTDVKAARAQAAIVPPPPEKGPSTSSPTPAGGPQPVTGTPTSFGSFGAAPSNTTFEAASATTKYAPSASTFLFGAAQGDTSRAPNTTFGSAKPPSAAQSSGFSFGSPAPTGTTSGFSFAPTGTAFSFSPPLSSTPPPAPPGTAFSFGASPSSAAPSPTATRPTESGTVATAPPTSTADSSSNAGDEPPDDFNGLLATTRLAGFPFPSHWDGTTLVSASTPHAVQLELTKKLQFLPRIAASDTRPFPFAGLRYLRTLQESMDQPELSLLYALELLHLPVETTTLTELEAYLRSVQGKQVDAHPLLLLAMGRWTRDVTYVKLFASKYPKARDAWLTADEARALSPASPTPTWSPTDPLQLWRALVDAESVRSTAMETLLGMVGIAKVKRGAIQLFQSARARKKMSPTLQAKNPLSLNFCFVGNAGTGKTTVARLFATLLFESGLRAKNVFVEVRAQSLLDQKVDAFRTLAASAKGGVLFIDEAFELDPAQDFKGRAIVSELAALAEKYRNDLTIILAGYEDEMETKLFSVNPGLKSRFQLIAFDDMSEVELHAVWDTQLQARGWTAPPELATIVSKRLAMRVHSKDFGNARSVRQEVEAATMSAMARPTFDGIKLVLGVDDVIGDHPLHNSKLEHVLDELEGKIGWASIKKSVRDLVQHCEKNYIRQLAGQSPLPLMLNRLFLGNPGTGKTSCAALYGRILKELHLLSSGDVVLKTASDLIGQYIGETQTKTQACLELARGKVLVIDEARSENDVARFLRLLDAQDGPKLAETIRAFETTSWNTCWNDYDRLSEQQLHILIVSLVKLPYSSPVKQPPSASCRRVGDAYATAMRSSSKNDDETIAAAEILVRFVQRLLKFHWDEDQCAVKEELGAILCAASSLLRINRPEHRAAQTKITELLDELEKPWIILLGSGARDDAPEVVLPSTRPTWELATVDWLLNPRLFQPSCLPVMKTPDTPSAGVYPSRDDYIKTIERLWTAMTFGDGNGALSSKCLEPECNQVLWPCHHGAPGAATCRTRDCQRPVVLVCSHRHHNRGLCGTCAARSQTGLIGPPGIKASTHVYDAEVFHVGTDGRIFLGNVMSRRPPAQAIHWRTTNRLSCPNLVGFVKVSGRGVPLRGPDRITWASIVPHEDSRFEDKRREAGELAVLCSGIVNVNVHELVHIGDHLVVVDCQIFVPEFIPVLKALELQKAITLPFGDGTWLNLSSHAPATSSLAFVEGDDDDVLLDRMLAMSTLDPIVQIRRDSRARAQLHTRLIELMRELTLDPGQRRSFLEALTHPVHLTQGPPGTGKSYLGVGLARALLIVRKLWIQQCPSVGQPPILVLSYKNHAIDEFLKDLVRTQSSLKYGTNGLVRIGGVCKDPELAPFSEQSVFCSHKEVKAQKVHLEQLHQLRGDVRHFSDDISPLVNFQYNLLNDATKESTTAAVYVQTLLLHLDMHAFTGDAVFDDPSWRTMFDALKTSTMQPMAGDHIEGLMRGIAHYHNQFQTTEVLWKWMTGFVPLPQCRFCSGDTTCDRVAWSRELALCESHVCSMDDCTDAVADEGRSYCRQHACTSGECDNYKLPGQVLCESHACFVCLASCPSKLAHPAEDAPPRNVCSRHPLCCASMCINEVLESSDYCTAHQKTTCRGKTKKGYACKAKVNSLNLPFCAAHRSQATRAATTTVTAVEVATAVPAPNDQMDVDDAMYTSCSAKTRKGKPCKAVFSQQKIPFCVDHKSQYVAKPTTTAPPHVAQDAVPGAVSPPATDCAEKPSSPVLLAAHAASPSEKITKSSDDEASDSEDSNDDYTGLLDEPCDKAALGNEDEVEESEHLQHLREVFDDVVYTRGDVDGSEALENEISDASMSSAATAAPEYDEAAVVPPRDWSWAMSLDERRRQLMLLESRHRGILAAWLGYLAKSVEHARQMLHDAEVKAKARVYEGKAVIGGTIVGCISRLESIRSTNPFAIIVEEASEVLEPLLFVCLGASTCKLEMIGDHLQLKPSVQSKFNFERINKIGVSMFERLIRAPADHAVPTSVLAIQRRMRQNICDLTRAFYTDIVAIEDHPTCATRTLPTSPLLKCLPAHGRDVPGVLPHVYFWTHEGRQQKASVGLSKINTYEADMVVALAKYLVACGVKPSSIAILTPYKGQLMLMREKLMKAKLVHREASTTADTVSLSTVDRFQGDEADIVLISLVIDAKSRTPFVKLVNRMIVLLSRARIGMYIVGNVGYFETTDNQAVAHWQATLSKLRGPAANDSGDDVDTVWFGDSRLGPKLPICCPLHPNERVVLATRPDQLQLGFCNVVCNAALPCSHVCGKTCHWPALTHNTACSVRVPSPCHRHTTALVCAQIYASLSGRRAPGSIDQALTLYQCRVSVDVLLPCSHTVSMPCVEETEISEGFRSWPECNKASVAPFIYTACKHTLTCTCAEYVRLTANPTSAKKCMTTVEYVPACGHGVSIPCYVRQQYAAAPHAFICSKKLTVALPRCGHLVTVPCNVAASLVAWSGESCSAGVVHEGEVYGPKDHACHEPVTFVKACGHTQKVACEVAFDLAKQSNACNVTDEFVNPVCGHTVQGPCHMKRSAMAVLRHQPAVATIDEGDVSQFEPCATFQQLKCKVPVLYRRRCQHQCTIPCSAAQAQKHVPKCSVAVVVPNVLCGHDVTVPCGDTDFRGYKPWPAGAAAPLVAGVLVDSVPPPAPLPTTCAHSSWANCPQMVTFERSSSCGHSFDMRCGAAFKLLGKTLPPCSHDTVVQLPCSHERQVQCFEVDGPQAPCTEEVLRECWNYAACRQRVVSLCSETDVVASCTRRTVWQCPSKVHSIEIAQCAEGIPSDCPRCSMDALDAELAQTEDLVARCSRRNHNVSLQDAVSDAMASMPPALQTYLAPYAVPLALRQFLERKLELLHGYKAVVEQMPEWQQPLYAPRTQLYYAVLSKAQVKTVEAMDPKNFVKQDTLYGICLQEWTAANVQWLKEKMTLLLCVGFSCRTLDPTTCVPKPDKKKIVWYDEQRALGADAIQVVAKKLECTIFWDPYTVMTTHKVCLTKRDVNALQMYASPHIDRHVQLVRRIERRMPGRHGAVALDEKPRAWMDNSVLATTRLAGFQFPSHWDGTTLVLASTPRSVQLELAKKLQSLPRTASMADASPFAGIRYLRTLQESMDLPELSLLHALELLHLPAETTTLTELEVYMRYVQDAQVDAHPLLFLAMGRWTKDVSYLRLFASTYPNARDAWLTADETRALSPASQTATLLPSDPSIMQLWEELAAAEHLSSAAMDDLLGMIGIGKVKRAAVQLFQSALARKKMPLAMRKKNSLSFNFCFVGNAGTGKTTVARTFATLLHESGLRAKDVFVETNAQTLKDEGAPEFRKLAASAMDGVLFIDEAYDLDPSSDFKGRAIVSELLTLSENHRDRLTIILAGYEDDMQTKLFSFNKGLKSRFQLITFDDFDEVELHAVWNMQLEARGWTAPPELATIVSKRLAIAANTKGFGNARAVRKEVEAATQSAMARPAFDGAAPVLCLEDVVGDHPLHNPKLERVLGELEGKIGWASIKKNRSMAASSRS